MKYYIYISDAKVDMLFPQVPHDIKKKVATEFGIDLKLLSAKRTVESESEDNRISRLEAVVEFIGDYGNIGTVDQPDEYVENTLVMKWGGYDSKETGFVYFGAETETTMVGLGGSMKNILGNENTGDAYPHSHSATPTLMNCLLQEFGLPKVPTNEYSERLTALDAVDLATSQIRGTSQKVEFLAKRLAHGRPTYRPDRKMALLATPLYVALAD